MAHFLAELPGEKFMGGKILRTWMSEVLPLALSGSSDTIFASVFRLVLLPWKH